MAWRKQDRRVEMPRRCAWCLRVCVRGTWIADRREQDEAAPAEATHTICEDCAAELRRRGLSV